MRRLIALDSVPSLLTIAVWVAPVGLLFSAFAGAAAQMPGQNTPGPGAIAAEQTHQGLHATVGAEVVDVTVCADSVIHVVTTPEAATTPPGPQPWMLDTQQSCAGALFTFARTPDAVHIQTALLDVEFSLRRGYLSFHTVAGDRLLNEGPSIPRTYEPVELNGDRTFRVKEIGRAHV